MPNPIEGLLEVYDDMVEVVLVLEKFHREDSCVEVLRCGASTCSKTFLFFRNDLLCMQLESIQDDL